MPRGPNRKFSKKSLSHREKWTNKGFPSRRKKYPNAIVGIAEGDSWFDYIPAWFEHPTKGDLLAQLMQTQRYNIHRVSRAGDTLDNMAFGTGYNRRDFSLQPPPMIETLAAIRKYKPKFFLFSAGGNDVAGHELEALLNHRDSKLSPLRSGAVDELFDVTVPTAFNHVIETVTAASPGIQIFLHGYGYTDPTGKGVGRLPNGWHFAGPWLRPALTKKRHLQKANARRIINDLIDKLNEAIIKVAKGHANVHFIDLRTKINYNDWINELHLHSDGWGKVVREFDKTMSQHL